MEEIWKDYLYNYQVSNLGRFKNKVTNHIYKPRLNNKGRYYVCVSMGDRLHMKTILIHRAVAEAFIPRKSNDLEVNHIDGNKQNNCVENLEWCTREENIKHAKINKLFKHGFDNHKTKLSDEDVSTIRNLYKNNTLSIGKIAKKYNVSKSCVSNIVNNKKRVINAN